MNEVDVGAVNLKLIEAELISLDLLNGVDLFNAD